MTRVRSTACFFAALALPLTALGSFGAASAQGVTYRPLTVAPHYARGYYAPPPPAYNPYAGPGVIVTAPVHFAGTVATAPFRAVNTIFPPQGSPLSIVGAPVYVAGKLVEFPFRVAEAPFGGPNPLQY